MAEGSDPEMVPLARLNRVVEEREAARAELARVKAELAQAQGSVAELATTKAALETLQKDSATKAKTWDQERTLLEAGVTDADGRAVAELIYNRLPVEDRPPLATWLASMRTDPAKAPKALAPYLGTAAANPAPPAQGAAPPANPQTKTPTTPIIVRPTETRTGAGEPVSKEAFDAAAKRAREEGTKEARDAYSAVRERYLAQG